MTTIFCSTKFKEFAGKAINITNCSTLESDISNWNGHLFYINRSKYLIFVNNKSYYAVVIPNVKKADLKNFDKLFLNRLSEQLVYDKVIDNSEVLILLSKLIPFQFSKTNNDKKTLGTLNEFVFYVKTSYDIEFYCGESLLEINNSLNTHLTGAGKNSFRDYGEPVKDMKLLIESTFKS